MPTNCYLENLAGQINKQNSSVQAGAVDWVEAARKSSYLEGTRDVRDGNVYVNVTNTGHTFTNNVAYR